MGETVPNICAWSRRSQKLFLKSPPISFLPTLLPPSSLLSVSFIHHKVLTTSAHLLKELYDYLLKHRTILANPTASMGQDDQGWTHHSWNFTAAVPARSFLIPSCLNTGCRRSSGSHSSDDFADKTALLQNSVHCMLKDCFYGNVLMYIKGE